MSEYLIRRSGIIQLSNLQRTQVIEIAILQFEVTFAPNPVYI